MSDVDLTSEEDEGESEVEGANRIGARACAGWGGRGAGGGGA